MAPIIILKREAYALILIFISLQYMITISSSASVDKDKEALLNFKQSLTNSSALSSWDPSSPAPCFGNKNLWVGLICSRGGNIYGIRLENMGLSGKIDIDALMGLPRLRSLSLMHNNFGGPMPDISKLRAFKSIFLSYNNFEGEIDTKIFDGLNRLKKVHLAYNKFSGPIPASLTNLQKLVEVRLEGNQFTGPIPDFKQPNLQMVNVSNNQLDGPIPPGLTKMDSSAFAGNKQLCGLPLNSCQEPAPDQNKQQTTPPTPPPPSKKSSINILIILAAVFVLVIALILIITIIKRRNTTSDDHDGVGDDHMGTRGGRPNKAVGINAAATSGGVDEGSHRSTTSTKNKGDSGKLCFVRNDREKFDLPDLLKASAEILGSGSFGSSYKASLMSSALMVVKRFKQMNNVGREEFQEHMRRLGRLDNKNLLPLVAYYYRKEEKLLVSDFVQKGSLAVLLHGNHSRGQPSLDWSTRLKIIKGVAKGLMYLYKELPCLVAPHGHLKSSNVLIDETYNPLLSDYGLIPLINQESAQELMVAYKSPEYVHSGRITKKTDVWSLGILIIETLTGEFPANYLQQGSEVDLSSWVNAVVGSSAEEEASSSQIFDKSMGGMTKNSEVEMHKLLKIGLACCESDVDKRLDIKEACEKIEEVKERDHVQHNDQHDDDFYTSYGSEVDVRSSRGMSDDFSVIVS